MITKLLRKLKAILFKSKAPAEITIEKTKNPAKSSKKQKSKSKSKKDDSKKIVDTLNTLPGVGAKSAKALYEAGFKTTKSIIAAKDQDLLAVPGVGINLVKKLKNIKK